MIQISLAATLGVLIVRTQRQRALLARCRDLPRADESVHSLVRAVCRRLGVRRVPSVRISDESSAPFVLGLVHPLLVLSHRQLVRPDELETVIVHEVAHLRRGDLLVRHLQWIAGALLFFWPVVAWVNRRIDAARECACDEWALRHGKLGPGDYARCLLRAVQPARLAWLTCHPAGMAANHTTIERRIDMILESPHRPLRRPAWGLLTCAFLLGWGVFALAGAADAGQSAQLTQQAWPATE